MYSFEELVERSMFGKSFVESLIKAGDIIPDEYGMFNKDDLQTLAQEELKVLG